MTKLLPYFFCFLIFFSCGPSSNDYVLSGEVKMEATNYKEAIADFTLALQIDDKNEKAYIKRGEAKAKLNLYSEAIKDWEAALSIDSTNENTHPLNVNALDLLSQGYFDMEDFNRSLSFDLKLIELEPNNPNHYFNAANNYHNLAKTEPAVYSDAEKYYKLAKEHGYDKSECNSRLKHIEEHSEQQIKSSEIAKNTYNCYWCNKGINKNNAFSFHGQAYSDPMGQFDIETEIAWCEGVKGSLLETRPKIFCSIKCFADYEKNN